MTWVRFAALAFILHLSWEMGQMWLYEDIGRQPWVSTLVPCSRAALFDAAVTIGLGLLFVAVGRRRPSVAPWVAMMAAGVVVAVVVERTGMAAGRWAYTGKMPTLPGTRLGILPILQMVLLPAVAAWFTLPRFNRPSGSPKRVSP